MKSKGGDIFFKRDGSGQKTTFADAFPEIESLSAQITESGPGNSGLGVRHITRSSYREFVNCSNVDCSGQGALTGPLLRRLVEMHITTYQDHLPCAGRLESGATCPNIFQINLEIIYKPRP